MTRTLRFLKRIAVPLAILLAWSAGSAQAQTYCTPQYSSGCTAADDINDFTLVGDGGSSFNQTATGCPSGLAGYSNFTTLPAVNMAPGNTYSGTISSSYAFGSENFRFFIDFNNDGVFDSGATSAEAVGFAGPTTNTTAIPYSITIPFGSTPGLHRMRVRCVFGGTASTINPCQSYTWGEVHDYTVNIAVLTPCTGTPLPGTAVASVANICPSQPFTVSRTGGTQSVSGLTFQLQTSATGAVGSYVNSGTAQASPTFNIAGITATTYYQIVVACGANSATTIADTVLVNSFTTCYCSPQTGTTLHSFSNNYFSNVTITGTTLNSSNGTATNGYTQVPPTPSSNTATLAQGVTYSLTATYNTAAGTPFGAGVWIDYDANGIFNQTTEYIPLTLGSASATATFTVPAGATIVPQTGLRVRAQGGTITSDPCAQYFSGETEDYLVTIVAGTPCSGTPTGGTAVASVASVCPNVPFTVTANGATTGLIGLTYQLQTSTTGAVGSYVNSGTAQSTPNFNIAGISATTYYRIVTTCTNAGGGVGTSVADTVLLNSATTCYCAPPTTILHISVNDYFTNVAIAGTTLNSSNGTNAATGYLQITPPPASNTGSMVLGTQYTITATHGTQGAPFMAAIWIDFDANGIFNQTNEYIPMTVGTSASTATFTVPVGGTPGLTGLRVRARGGTVTSDPCLQYGSGETEDYLVTLVAPVPCSGTPLAGTANTSNTNPCPGTQVSISISGGTLASNITFQLQSSTTSATAGFTNVVGASNASGTFTATPPMGNIWYRIVSTCNNTGGGTANSVSVLVTGQGAITTLPWNDGLESVTTTGANFPQCWRRVNGDWETRDANWWFSNDPRTGIRYLTNAVSGTQNEWIMTPGFQLTAGTSYDFSFYWVGDGNTGWTGHVGVNNIQDSTGATILGAPFVTSTVTTSNSAYQQVIRTFVPTTTGTYFFGVRVGDNFFGSNLGFDDFRVNVTPTCPQPVMGTVTGITANQAVINWTPATTPPSLGYRIEVRSSGAPGSGAVGLAFSGSTPSSGTNILATGLAGTTVYTAYVRAVCAVGDSSFWSSTTFTTSLDCATATNITACGVSQTFSVTGTGSYNPIQTATGTAPYGTPGLEKLYTFTAPVTGPYTINVTTTNSQWVDYFFKPSAGGCGNTGWTFIQDVINPTITNTFNLTAGTQYYILADPEQTPATGQTFSVVCPPTCGQPNALNVTTTTTTAALSWTQPLPGTPTQWQISYGPTGATAGTGTLVIANANPFTVTGLTPSTGYTFYVRAICGPGDTSLWSFGVNQTTQCVATSLPFVENFSNLNFNFPPICWSRNQGPLTATPTSLSNSGFSSWNEDGYLNVGSTGSAHINIYGSFPQREWLISPSINLAPTPGNYLLEFDFGITVWPTTTPSGLGSDDTVAVVVSTDNGLTWSLANAIQIWTAANTPVNTTTGGQRFYIPMNGYSGTVKIGWYGSNGTVALGDNDIFVDSIRLTSSCTPPVVNLGNDTTVCGNIGSFILNAGNPGANTTYVWSSPVATIPATTQTINIGPAINFANINNASPLVNSIPVYATVTTSPNCSASDSINISVIFTPRVSGIGVAGTDPAFSFSPVSDSFATSYVWNFGDGTAPVTTTLNTGTTHTYTQNGTYTVSLVVNNACGSDTVTQSITVVGVPNGIDQVLDGGTVSLYPNPTAADAVLEVGNGVKLRGVQVMSATGQLVMERQASNGSNRMTLRTGTLAPGIYTLRIQLDKGVVVRKLEVLK